MTKRFVRSVSTIAVVAASFLMNIDHAQAVSTPAFCAPGAMMKTYRQAYAASSDAVASVAAVQSTLNDFLKVDGVLSRFIVTAADGKLIKEISTVTANTKGFVIDPKTLRSAKSVNFFKNVELGHTPMASSLLDGYDRLAMLTSVVGLGLNLSTALQTGDPLDHAKVTKDVVDLGSALALTYRGWQGLQLAFSSVGFIDYALNSLITAQYAQYDEYWWQGYRSYMDARFPKMVTGNNSWAALVTRGDNGKAFQARLMEFWSEKDTDDGLMSPADRAQHYYKVPSPFQRDALAGATDKYKQAFAARYYKDTLQATIETYLKRQNEAFIEEARDRLEVSTETLCDYLTELSTLQVKVAKLQKAEKITEAKEGNEEKDDVASLNLKTLGGFKIKAAQGTHDGPPIDSPVALGEIAAFRATVPLLGKEAKGQLSWVLLSSSGQPVLGATKSVSIKENGETAEAKVRFQLSNIKPGRYHARLTHHVDDEKIKPVSSHFAFDVGALPEQATSLGAFDIKANKTTYDGDAIKGSIALGEIAAFSATVPLLRNDTKGQLTWVLLSGSGQAVPGAVKSTSIEETGETTEAKVRFQLSNIKPGRYRVRLSHDVDDEQISSVSSHFDFDVGETSTISITRLWVTDTPKNETHFAKLAPEQTPVLYVAFKMGDGIDVVQRKLLVRDLSTGDIVVSSEGEKKRKDESAEQRTGIALEAWQLEPGEKYRFEATLTIPDGASVTQSQNFEIAKLVTEEKIATRSVATPKDQPQPQSNGTTQTASVIQSGFSQSYDYGKQNWQKNKVYQDIIAGGGVFNDPQQAALPKSTVGECLTNELRDGSFLDPSYDAIVAEYDVIFADRVENLKSRRNHRCKALKVHLAWSDKRGHFAFKRIATKYYFEKGRDGSGQCAYKKNELNIHHVWPNKPTNHYAVYFTKQIAVRSAAEAYDLQKDICFSPDKFIKRYLPEIGLNPTMPTGCDKKGKNCTVNQSHTLN